MAKTNSENIKILKSANICIVEFLSYFNAFFEFICIIYSFADDHYASNITIHSLFFNSSYYLIQFHFSTCESCNQKVIIVVKILWFHRNFRITGWVMVKICLTKTCDCNLRHRFNKNAVARI